MKPSEVGLTIIGLITIIWTIIDGDWLLLVFAVLLVVGLKALDHLRWQ